MKNIILIITVTLISTPVFSQVFDVTPASGASLPSGTVNQTLRNSDGGTTYVANSALVSDGTKAGVGGTGTEKFNIDGGSIELDNNYFLRSKSSGGTLANLIGVNSSDNIQIVGPSGADIYFANLTSVIKSGGNMGINTGGSPPGVLGVYQSNNLTSHKNSQYGGIVIGNKGAGQFITLDFKGSGNATPIGRISLENVGADNSVMHIGTSNAYASGVTNDAIQINKSGQVGLSLTLAQNASALLEMNSNTQGLLISRGTFTQRNAIPSPATLLMYGNTSNNKINFFNGTSWRALVDSTTAEATYWKLGGQNTTANANIGTLDNYRFGISVNSNPILYFDPSGRMRSSTMTDAVLSPSDSMKISGATVDIAGAIKLTGAVAHVGDVDMNSYDLTEADSISGTNGVTITSTSGGTPAVFSGSFHSLPVIRAINGSGNAGIILENTPDDNHSYMLYRTPTGNLMLSRSDDQPYSSENDTIFHYNQSTGEIDFVVNDILLNGNALGGTAADDLGDHNATDTLEMNQFNIVDVNKITADSADIDVLAGNIAAPGTLNVGTLQIGGNAITDGTWTPTLTNTLNVGASTAYACNYMRVGNTVTVSGRVDIDAVATGSVILEMSLPIASNFTSFENAGGTGASTINTTSPIYASAANDRLLFVYTATVATNEPFHFSATYRIQ